MLYIIFNFKLDKSKLVTSSVTESEDVYRDHKKHEIGCLHVCLWRNIMTTDSEIWNLGPRPDQTVRSSVEFMVYLKMG